MINVKRIIISLFILMSLLVLWLGRNALEIQWLILKFNMRHLLSSEEEQCDAIKDLWDFGVKIDSPLSKKEYQTFLKKDYPNLLRRNDKVIAANLPQRNAPWSQYKLIFLFRVPRDYVIAYMFEYKIPPSARRIEKIYSNMVVYKRNITGKYSQIERCRKRIDKP